MSIFEVIMLICFAAAWPVSIYKSIKSKSTKGKSVFFLIILLVGYVMGILNKICYSFDNVIYLYCVNFILVFIDTMLYLKNRKLEKALEAQEERL